MRGVRFLVVFFLFVPLSAFAGQVMTLAQCRQEGVRANTTLEAARYRIEAARHDVLAARADFLPSLSTGYSVSRLGSISSKGATDADYLDQNVRNFSIKLSQVLFSGWRLVNGYQTARIREQMAEAEKEMSRLEVVYRIEAAFYRLMKAKEDLATAQGAVDRLEESVRAARAFFDKALVPYVDVLQARVDLADAREQLGIAENNVNRQRLELFALMDRPDDPNTVFASQGGAAVLGQIPDFETSYAKALEHRPNIKSLKSQAAIARKEASMALGKYLPQVRFDIGYYDYDRDYDALGTTAYSSYDRDQRNRYWSSGVFASWEFFDGGRAWHEKDKFRAEEKRVQALIREAEKLISTGLHQALYAMAEAKQRMAGTVEALAAAEEYYAMEARRLKAGVSTIPNLLDAQDRLLRAQGNKAQAVLDFQLAESEMKFMRGQ